MSDNTKEMKNEIENKELNDLLDSALADFDKLSVPSAKQDSVEVASDPQKQTEKYETSENNEKDWTEDFFKQTIDQMDKNLQNFAETLKNGDEELNELKSVLQTLEQASASNATDGEDNISAEFESAISQVIKSLSVPSENIQSETDCLAAMLGQTSLDSDGGDVLSFVQGMMQQLLSKEILYPILKEVLDKYPAWLEEHKATLSPSDLQKYTKQFELLQKVCSELEKEKEDDTKEIKQRRFETIMSLMQEIEKCGQLPQELASTVIQDSKGNFLDEISSVLCRNI
ncbi:peroxisomal biogenesis factor 19 [Harpegnathos saltator]|uniref:Peroxin-19 n=1 Tax=Harpegnathos saltator TaxID=610380 RepID=E2B6I4_HARSA|nr:peroxisomal biogenesis factor 19 [Harpegnathos saltator]EFN88728.1 Peroxisomal biogenesis factor 19 [Harpegnathos saltator]